ncbi:MAG: carbamate kinase [Oligoflexia bacterium]|nr:carbamate kinase [Oligoflexia bacterium]
MKKNADNNKKPSILIALGGNALNVIETPSTSLKEEFNVAYKSVSNIVDLISEGYSKIILTHGNGPQVGRIFLQQELTKNEFPRQTTLDMCVADTQGRIGYTVQNVLANICKERKIDKNAYTIVTQVLVDAKDGAFTNPTKPVGSFYTEEESKKLIAERGWVIKQEGKKGFRRVVPSPVPIDIIEKDIFKTFIDNNIIAIGGGGGGIPVIRNDQGKLEGVDAVIDKDRTSALLANEIGIDVFVILTEADHVCLKFHTPEEKALKNITITELEKYYNAGEFPAGSMGPKVEAVISFLRNGGKRAIIANLFHLKEALAGTTGTQISA